MVENSKPVVALLAAPETSPSVLYGLYDVLYSVGAVYPDMTCGEPGPDALDVRIVAAEAAPFHCLGSVAVEPHAAIGTIERADVVVVCDMYTPIHQPISGKYPREIAWLRRMHAGGALIASVCSGSLVLAEAGLLDGHEAAAHWAPVPALLSGSDDARGFGAVPFRRERGDCHRRRGDGVARSGIVSDGTALWTPAGGADIQGIPAVGP